MNDVTQYREHRSTHPTLIKSAEGQILRWYSLIKKDGNVQNQFRTYFGGSTDSFDAMVNGILTNEEVLALGDQKCSALHPVVWDTGAKEVVAPGKKAKIRGGIENLVPAVVAVVGDTLVFAMWVGQGYAIDVYPKSSIRSAEAIKMGAMLMSFPAVQFVLDDGDVINVGFNQMGGEARQTQTSLTEPF